MSKTVTKNSILSTFPIEDDHLKLLASITAFELEELYNECDYVNLYGRIDELDESILNILAYDFKMDWWDNNYTLEEKRQLFKDLWLVHKKLGTPQAVSAVISGIYPSVIINEWYKYNGQPYRFKLLIDMGDTLPSMDKLSIMLPKIDYFKNQRSYLEGIEFNVTKKAPLYIGAALQSEFVYEMAIEGINPDDYIILTDEDGNFLTDENGNILVTGG